MPAPHAIGRLTLDVATGDLDGAPALRDRIVALTQEAIPAALERAFDALGLGEDHLRIERLDLDLGELRPETLEADLIAALDRAIGPALRKAKGKRLTAARAELATLRHYLASGTTPTFAGPDFDPAARLNALSATELAEITRNARGTARRRLATLGHAAMPHGEARLLDPNPGRSLYVRNAGLVLTSPYLPALFDKLGLLSADGKVSGFDPASRAVHLLEYLATGRLDTPEPALVLNKLLAGLPLDTPVAASITASPADLETCDGLLAAMIANWRSIRNTSPEGLRETFLQREGRLDRIDDRWNLRVQHKGLDVLVDQVPWTFATIFHRWMPRPIHVTW